MFHAHVTGASALALVFALAIILFAVGASFGGKK